MDRGAWQATVLGITRVQHDLATKPPTTTTIYIYLYPFPLQVVYSAPSPCTFPSFFLFFPLPSFCFFFLKIIPILLKSYSVYDLFHSLVYLINCVCVRTISFSGGGGKPSFPSPSAGDLRELPKIGRAHV